MNAAVFLLTKHKKNILTTHIFLKHHRIKIKMATTGGGDTQQQQQKQQHTTPQHKQTVLDLGKYIDKGVRVKLSGGREVEGILKGSISSWISFSTKRKSIYETWTTR